MLPSVRPCFARRAGLSLARCQRRSFFRISHEFLKVSEEVREAIRDNIPVVALESTIYTHGFPSPDNLALATHLESVVRLNGAVPATIGVLNGMPTVGFTAEELIELLSSAGKEETMKVSRRDLPYIVGLVSSFLSS
jgi:pseudouridine-5'-phosphate glycosidase/pseudouridine kinase